jgi:Fur family transcriptional regulator, iron response regulator
MIENSSKNDIKIKLRKFGLRPTRQRMALAGLLFKSGDRHVTAEGLHEEAERVSFPISLATVYNTLNQFTEAGLLREVAVEGSKAYFDTNTSDHHHFFCEADNSLMDIPDDTLKVLGIPAAPAGMSITRVDVIIRLADFPREACARISRN